MEENFFFFGKWRVDALGNIYGEANRAEYCINNDRLEEPDWMVFLLSLGDEINWNELWPAYYKACILAKIEEVTFKINENYEE